MQILSGLSDRPIISLTCCFVLWKTLILLVVLFSPGPGYDTSTLLLDSWEASFDGSKTVQNQAERSSRAVYKFIRWDAIYYTEIARRGRLFEQEWAFGYGHTTLLSRVAAGI